MLEKKAPELDRLLPKGKLIMERSYSKDIKKPSMTVTIRCEGGKAELYPDELKSALSFIKGLKIETFPDRLILTSKALDPQISVHKELSAQNYTLDNAANNALNTLQRTLSEKAFSLPFKEGGHDDTLHIKTWLEGNTICCGVDATNPRPGIPKHNASVKVIEKIMPELQNRVLSNGPHLLNGLQIQNIGGSCFLIHAAATRGNLITNFADLNTKLGNLEKQGIHLGGGFTQKITEQRDIPMAIPVDENELNISVAGAIAEFKGSLNESERKKLREAIVGELLNGGRAI